MLKKKCSLEAGSKPCLCQASQLWALIPAFRRLKQDYCEFNASLSYMQSPSLTHTSVETKPNKDLPDKH